MEKINKNKKRKKRNRLVFRSIVLAILLAAVVYALVSNLTKDQAHVEVGEQAQDFELEQVNGPEGATIKLSDLQGKGVMLNFWATYCDPCKAEMPYMEKLYPEYKEKGVEIVAVNLDVAELVIDRFIEKYDLTFPIVHDKGAVMEAYDVGPIPSTFFINADGKVVRAQEGALTLEKLEGYLQEIVPK